MSNGAVGATRDFTVATVGFGIDLVNVGAILVTGFTTFLSALPLLVFLTLVGVASIPWINYNDVIVEEAEFAITETVYPLYRDFVRPFLELVGIFVDNLICWYDAVVGYPFILIQDVLYPLGRDCGVTTPIVNAVEVIKILVRDFLVYIVTGEFVNQPFDFTELCDAWIIFWESWQDLVCCSCNTLCGVLKVIPIIPTVIVGAVNLQPFIVILPFIAGDQLKDPQTWCAISNTVNAALALVQELFRLILALIQLIFDTLGNVLSGLSGAENIVDVLELSLATLGQTLIELIVNMPKPNFRETINYLCDAISCAVRSVENSFQLLWDTFIPFKFVFANFFCVVDVAACIALKVLGLALDILFHIIEVVQYPAEPYWEEVVKVDFIEIVNLIHAPTNFDPIPGVRGENSGSPETLFTITNYYLDTNLDITPLGTANPLYQKTRLTECICIFVRRFICDPTLNETACFDNTGVADSILRDFDFCCIFDAAGRLVVDTLVSLFEVTFHLASGSDRFFIFIDVQPFFDILKENLVFTARCLLSVFALIPVVGKCLQDIVVAVARWALCLAVFVIDLALGLITLPYFLSVPSMVGTPNFLSRADEALNKFVSINRALIDQSNPESLISCLCRILNLAFQIPPIGCPSCQIFQFPGVPVVLRDGSVRHTEETLFPYGRLMITDPDPKYKQKLFDPYKILSDMWGYRKEWDIKDEQTAGMRTSPIRHYRKPGGLKHGYDPMVIRKMIFSNAELISRKYNDDLNAFFNAKETREFIRTRKENIIKKWDTEATCKKLKEERSKLPFENRREYFRNLRNGRYEPLKDGTCAAQPKIEEDKHMFVDRLTTAPTPAPLTCGNATMGIPEPPCFDMCCIVRTALDLAVHVLSFVARFFNGLAQGAFPDQQRPGEGQFGYFTGEFCDREPMVDIDDISSPLDMKPCFESDITMLIIKAVSTLKCACEFINLIVPITAENPRGDLCCAIQRVGELLACIVNVLVNAINALALGGQDEFAYYRNGIFQEDIGALFDVTLQLVDCICVLIRGIFPLNFIPGFQSTIEFDPCCFVDSILKLAVELLQLLVNVIIAIATIPAGSPESLCYWSIDTRVVTREEDGMMVTKPFCEFADFGPGSEIPDGTISTIGFVQDVMMVVDQALPDSDEQCYTTCGGNDPGSGGIIPCVCQVVNALLPVRQDPSKPVSCRNDASLNCMFIDFCCPLVKAGIAVKDSIRFVIEAFASLWQSWEPGYPEFFTAYLFCNEDMPNYGLPDGAFGQVFNPFSPTPDVSMLLTPQSPNGGTFKCGKLKPIINNLVGKDGLLTRCVCEYLQILDWLLSEFFKLVLGESSTRGWGNCFCGARGDPFTEGVGNLCGNPGDPNDGEECTAEILAGIANRSNSILYALGYLIQTLLEAAFKFIRRLPDITFWNPTQSGEISTIEDTFIYNFIGPVADAACLTLGNLICFVNSLFFIEQSCNPVGKRFLGGAIRWIFDIVIRVIAFIEGFIEQLVGDGTCEFENGCKDYNSAPIYGVTSSQIGNAIAGILSIPIDIFIADGSIVCTSFCSDNVLSQVPNPCYCYNQAPSTRADPEFVNQWYGVTSAIEIANWWQPNQMDPTKCDSAIPGVVPDYRSPQDGISGQALQRPICSLEECVMQKLCILKDLPTCGAFPETPDTIVDPLTRFQAIDGILLGFIRYLKCVFGEAGALFYPIEVIFSVFWQISGAIINFVVALLVFLFSVVRTFYLFFVSPLFFVLGVAGDFFTVLGTFLDIFFTPINVPPYRDAPHRKSKRSSFADVEHWNATHQDDQNLFQLMGDFLYDYDTSDCFDDLNSCVCRNFNLTGHCTWNSQTETYSPLGITTTSTIQYLSDNMFTDQFICSSVVNHFSGMSWDAVPFADKISFVDCIEKRIRGERVAYVMPIVPPNFFYSHRGPLDAFLNLGHSIQGFWRKEENYHSKIIKDENKAFKTEFPKFRSYLKTRKENVIKIMTNEHHIDRNSPIFDGVVELDQIWAKYNRGYYHYLFDVGLRHLKRGNLGAPTTRVAARDMVNSFTNVFKTIYYQPYAHIVDSVIESNQRARRIFKDMLQIGGPIEFVKDINNKAYQKWKESPKGYSQRKRRQQIKSMVMNSPVVRLYNYATTPVAEGEITPVQQYLNKLPIYNHMSRVIKHQQDNWKDYKNSIWNVHRKYHALKTVLSRRWKPRWTRTKLQNWRNLEMFFYKTVEAISPGMVPKHKRELFLLNSDCRIVDDTVRRTSELVDFCINDFTVTRRNVAVRNMTNDHRYRWERMPLSKDNPNARKMRRLIHKEVKQKRHIPGKVDRRVYRRVVSFGVSSGPTGFNLFDQVLCWFEEIFDVSLSQDFDQFVMDIKEWFFNPNLDIMDYPDVGFKYWIRFLFRCDFFDNLNCSVGVGLEEALLFLLKWYFLIAIPLLLLAPGLGGVILIPAAFLIFVVVLPAMAWHYSPRCWLMTPSIPAFGIQVPIFPFPISPPALPICIGSEFRAIFDKYITDCYDFIIPRHLVWGPVCPAPGVKIDFVNCKSDVGISDGLQNILYGGYRVFGMGWITFINNVASTCIGMLWPGLMDYLDTTFEGFTSASETQMMRQDFCFWATLPSLALPLGIIILLGIVGGTLVLALIALGKALFNWLSATPLSAAVPGNESPWLDLPQDESLPEREDPGLTEGIGNLFESAFIRRKRKKD